MKNFYQVCILLFLLLKSTLVFPETSYPNPIFKTPQILSLRMQLAYLDITMPNNQPQMGIAGFNLLHPFWKNFYAGLGIYSSVTGQYNGFFSMGMDGGVQYHFSPYFGVDAGVYLGASGGHHLGGTQIGDGPLTIVHAGLFATIKHIEIGLSDSYAKFLEGEKIASQQLLVSLSVPFDLCAFSQLADIPAHFKAHSSPMYIGVPISLYIPANAYFLDGTEIKKTMTLLGVEFGHIINNPFYYYIGVENAVSGTTIGFSVLKGGLEWLNFFRLPRPFFTDARLGLLAVGGNSIDSAGGLSVESQAGVGVYVTKMLSLRWLAGYLSSFGGRYHDMTTSIALDYHFSILSLPGDEAFDSSQVTPHYFRLRVANQTYFNNHIYFGVSPVINSFNVKIDDVLSTHWFLTGQGSFSYSGVPGCYATGLLGAGYQIPLKPRWLMYVSAMGGGGSGGSLLLGQGVLLQGSLGTLYQLTPSVGTTLAVSKAYVINSSFSPWVLEAGLSFNLNFLT
ncbi:MAG: hypothetical protein NTZ67_02545 [Gammaproteobacteria bacterium]|nr:hypothetical protein [Gammaproteobacteria bacterium]